MSKPQRARPLRVVYGVLNIEADADAGTDAGEWGLGGRSSVH